MLKLYNVADNYKRAINNTIETINTIKVLINMPNI
jgi:hypothetical protein